MSARPWTGAPWRVDHFLGMIVGSRGEPISGPENYQLTAAAPDLAEACLLFVEWCDKESAGPQYSSPARRDGPNGEAEWKLWWHEQLRLAAEGPEAARAALAKAGVK